MSPLLILFNDFVAFEDLVLGLIIGESISWSLETELEFFLSAVPFIVIILLNLKEKMVPAKEPDVTGSRDMG